MAKGDGMELLPICKRVIGLDIHQAEITACAIIEESSGEAQTGRPLISGIPACGCCQCWGLPCWPLDWQSLPGGQYEYGLLVCRAGKLPDDKRPDHP